MFKLIHVMKAVTYRRARRRCIKLIWLVQSVGSEVVLVIMGEDINNEN